jgi:P27 family predicted phage terminase small subunit
MTKLALIHPAPDPKRPPSPPRYLRAATRRWFSTVVNLYTLEDHHIRLLTLACSAWDRAEQAREALAEHGLTCTDRYGTAKARPEVQIERDSRLAFARMLRELDLDADVTPEPSRPPAIRSNRRGAFRCHAS